MQLLERMGTVRTAAASLPPPTAADGLRPPMMVSSRAASGGPSVPAREAAGGASVGGGRVPDRGSAASDALRLGRRRDRARNSISRAARARWDLGDARAHARRLRELAGPGDLPALCNRNHRPAASRAFASSTSRTHSVADGAPSAADAFANASSSWARTIE